MEIDTFSSENLRRSLVKKTTAPKEVGEGSPSQKIKALHRIEGGKLSLRAFARKLLKDENSFLVNLAKSWFKNKSPAGQTKRSAANTTLAKTISAAVKNARRAASSKK